MAEQRKVRINMNAVEITQIIERTNIKEFYNAIGYLSTWNMTHPSVAIHMDGPTDLTAVYRGEDNSIQYIIGAVWHDDHYGFHS